MIGKNNLQDVFFNKIRKEKISVVVFLINGVRLEGIVTWFDNFCILLKNKGKKQMIYKHAISTVEGVDSFSLFENNEKHESSNQCNIQK